IAGCQRFLAGLIGRTAGHPRGASSFFRAIVRSRNGGARSAAALGLARGLAGARRGGGTVLAIALSVARLGVAGGRLALVTFRLEAVADERQRRQQRLRLEARAPRVAAALDQRPGVLDLLLGEHVVQHRVALAELVAVLRAGVEVEAQAVEL